MHECGGTDLQGFRLLSQIFFCKHSSFPLKYLGVLLHVKFRTEDLQPIIDKIIKRICGWRVKLLSYEAKLVLLCTCIARSYDWKSKKQKKLS